MFRQEQRCFSFREGNRCRYKHLPCRYPQSLMAKMGSQLSWYNIHRSATKVLNRSQSASFYSLDLSTPHCTMESGQMVQWEAGAVRSLIRTLLRSLTNRPPNSRLNASSLSKQPRITESGELANNIIILSSNCMWIWVRSLEKEGGPRLHVGCLHRWLFEVDHQDITMQREEEAMQAPGLGALMARVVAWVVMRRIAALEVGQEICPCPAPLT